MPIKHRRSIRLKDFDYSTAGAYYVTIVAHNRACIFGDLVDGKMRLNELGHIVKEEWMKTTTVRKNVSLGVFVIMPNHVHGIILLNDTVGAIRWVALKRNNGDKEATRRVASTTGEINNAKIEYVRVTRRVAPTGGPAAGSIGAIIGQFKSVVTKRIRKMRKTQDLRVWQRNYYEHVIRNEKSLEKIRDYIVHNPLNWQIDRENPDRTGEDEFDSWLASFKARPL